MHTAGGEARWVAYEDNAAWRLGQVASMGEKTLRLHSGEKIPRRRVWLEDAPPPSPQLQAQVAAAVAALPPHELWQAASGREALSLQELAAAASGGNDGGSAQQLAVLQQVLANPVYFRRRGKQICPADAATIEKALAARQQRQAQQDEEAALRRQLAEGALPPALRAQHAALLLAPDKNAPLYRALKSHCGADGSAFAKFFVQHGILADARAYFELLFRHKWPPPAAVENPVHPAPPLPAAAAAALSIDDAGTTEIDDAFSLAAQPDGSWRLGIHIAAPALCLSAAGRSAAQQRMISVYFPHARTLMLPAAAVDACSLAVDAARPALSLYLRIQPASGDWHEEETLLENVRLAAALTPPQADAGDCPPAIAAQLAVLGELAEVIAKRIPPGGGDAGVKIDAAAMQIIPRPREGITRVVEVLMRCVNTLWGQRLAAARSGGLFRHDGALHLRPANAPYAWLTSPLRRYVDFANQRLLLALLAGAPPPAEAWAALRRQFNQQQQLAQQFQRTMETYWAMAILQQQPPQAVHSGTHLGRGRVRLERFPLTGALLHASPDLPADAAVRVRLAEADLIEQRLLFALAEV